jgi:hypothetical protein
MINIPLTAVPAQTVSVQVLQQAATLTVYQKTTGLYVDVYVNDALVLGGVAARNLNRIVRDLYLGFSGDLTFFDTMGTDDPDYTGLGGRFQLLYMTPQEVAGLDR